jgi:hypothetical protein
MDEPIEQKSQQIDRRLELLANSLATSNNPFLHGSEALEVVWSINGFGINWLSSRINTADIRDRIMNALIKALPLRPDSAAIVDDLGRVLRSEIYSTSWVNTEKQRMRHRLIDLLGRLCVEYHGTSVSDQAFRVLLASAVSEEPTVTLDVRGQCIDSICECLKEIPSLYVDTLLVKSEEIIRQFGVLPERPQVLLITAEHDTIDPHIDLSSSSFLEILLRAARRKAQERAFVFTTRLLDHVLEIRGSKHTESLAPKAENGLKSLATIRAGVLTTPIFVEFIKSRLPSHVSHVSDYIVNRHQIITDGLTVHELCRILIAAPENKSSEKKARRVINAFFRQVFGMGQAANAGLDARPFFIDHGYGYDGVQLDWPSYVFLPSGVVWGKGAGVDLSCGVAFGGGVDLHLGRGRDGAYIGGSWSATLYHGHSHIGGTPGSEGAASRERIKHFGLTVEDACRLPWGVYIEAEHQINGDVYPGVRTYLLEPVR